MKQQIENYYQQVINTPWGKLFYDVLFHQLGPRSGLKILDFGSGFGVTASHYGQANKVTAIEPNQEMLNLAEQPENYTQLIGDETSLIRLPPKSFDLIICHNVLEYVDNQSLVMSKLFDLLKDDGELSLIIHNKTGAIIQEAVLMDRPETALEMLDSKGKESYFGNINYVTDEVIANAGGAIKQKFGIRSLYGLSQNNEIKQTKEWQGNMLALELRLSETQPFVEMAFYHHLILEGC